MDLIRSEALYTKLLFLTETWWFICVYMENKTISLWLCSFQSSVFKNHTNEKK